jgi:tetratricopeptide (TPR) repeat protein
LFQTGKVSAAERKWTAALKIAEHNYGENVTEYSSLLMHLGQMYLLIGKYPSAETMLQRCLAAAEKTSGSNSVDRAIVMSSLAQAYTKQRKFAEAEPLVLKSVEASNVNCSAVPIPCAFIRSNLGDYYMTKGQWATAQHEFEQSLKLRADTLGEHPLVADSLISLSRALRKLKRKKEAKIYEARANQILTSQRNPAYDLGNTIDVRAFQGNDR